MPVCRANRVFVLDEATLAIQQEIPVGIRVWGLALNADGTRLYTTDGASGQVSVIDTVANKVVATVPVKSAAGVTASPAAK